MQPEVKTTDTVNFDFVSRPIEAWKNYKHEKVFIGNIGHVYPRFKSAIERHISIETRLNVWKVEKDAYEKYVDRNCKNQFEKDMLLMEVERKTNATLNNWYADKVVKIFFAYLKENKLDAKQFLEII